MSFMFVDILLGYVLGHVGLAVRGVSSDRDSSATVMLLCSAAVLLCSAALLLLLCCGRIEKILRNCKNLQPLCIFVFVDLRAGAGAGAGASDSGLVVGRTIGRDGLADMD